MGWKVGNGQSIRIGIDPIATLNLDFVLPEDLRIYLEDYGITTLSDAHFWGSGSFDHQYWLTAEHIDLDGDWMEACTLYIEGLSHGGIRLGHCSDSLAWMHNKRSGKVIA